MVDKIEILKFVRGNHGTYEIRLGRDEQIYCTCRGWVASRTNPKTCRHLREFLAEEPRFAAFHTAR